MSVVVDVGFVHVLRLGVDVRLMIVFNGWMIVLVGMSRRHVLPLTAVPEIVHYVSMFVSMNNRVMFVLHGLPLVTPPSMRNLLAVPLGKCGNGRTCRNSLSADCC